MNFSTWDWATHFRLHEAACLIAGVMPISKKNATSEELPSQVRPILIALISAYYGWLLLQINPNRPERLVLEGPPDIGGALPPFPALHEVSGEIVCRAALHRFISESGRKSAYDFSPVEQVAPLPSCKDKISGADDDWQTKAQQRAREIIKRQKEKDLYPSQLHIAEEIANKFRRDGITGADGKPLSAGTIKRHALTGISSAQGKCLSTSIA